jgi:hypothetical protein
MVVKTPRQTLLQLVGIATDNGTARSIRQRPRRSRAMCESALGEDGGMAFPMQADQAPSIEVRFTYFQAAKRG